jgi:hypothetical protein
MRTINTEVAAIILVGFLLTVSGIYLNYQNLNEAFEKNYDELDKGDMRNKEIIFGFIQLLGMAIMFVGATQGLLRRSDVMANKFVNIMDVFTSLVKKQIEMIGKNEGEVNLAEIEEKSQKFKQELKGLRRI